MFAESQEFLTITGDELNVTLFLASNGLENIGFAFPEGQINRSI